MELPEWLATFVGRLVLENEMLRQTLIEMQKANEDGPLSDTVKG